MDSGDPRPKLRHYFGELASGSLPMPLHLLVWTRELIEYLDAKDSYPLAHLYGNWAVHTKLTGSAAGYDLLFRVNTRLVDLPLDDPETQSQEALAALSLGMAQELSLRLFRTELARLYHGAQIPAPFLQSHRRWHQLVAGIYSEIRGKPIRWPPGDPQEWRARVRQAYEAVRQRHREHFGHTRGFITGFLVDVIHLPGMGDDPRKGRLHWIALLEGGASMVGAIVPKDTEPRAAFTLD